MELINNTTKTLRDDLSVEMKKGSKLSIAAACFSIYAFQELKKQLSDIDELRFIFTSPTFITEKAKKEKREFYIPRLNRERSLYGTEFEIKLRNELTQKAIAKECAEWIKKKVSFKSNISDKTIQGGIVVDDVGYTPINNFTTIELGCEKGNVISTTIVKDNSLAKTLLADFNEIWNDNKVLQEVTDEVIDSITAAYNENSPDFIYFVTLYNIFNEFLEDVSEDVLPNEATGFKDSKIWSMLYNFQKDAALAIINKLEKYNGCILADSVGLGKTFTALAVIKYYENRNKSVLVLCPKKLTNNWNTYKDNYVNNPIASDRLRYDVLYHTDLNRTHGKSNGLDLDRLNWGNYDLVVIDESHNFRNGGKIVENPDENDKENRYVKLLKKVIRAGVKTKVLMLSATPVNNRFNDLKNQLALAYEGHTEYIDDKLNTTRSIDDIFKNAQRAFNTWSKWEPCDRTTENLLKMLDFDFFEVLDSVTIARSRKHIQKYYDTSDIGTFPTRLKPISLRPHLTDLKSAITYNQIFEQLIQRFGRIDRIGSKNKVIQLVNFWPDVTLDEYINLKAKVETRMKIVDMTATGDDNLLSDEEKTDLEYRKAQLRRLQDEVVDIEDMTTGISIMDLGLNEFRLDLLDYIKHHPDIDKSPFGLHAVARSTDDTPAGVIYVLKNRSNSVNIDNQNRLHPFYMVYISNDGEVICDHLSPKEMLDKMRYLCKGKTEADTELCKQFNKETRDGRNMSQYSNLLGDAIASIIKVKDESDIDSFLGGGQISFLMMNTEYLHIERRSQKTLQHFRGLEWTLLLSILLRANTL